MSSQLRPLSDWRALNLELVVFPCEPQIKIEQAWMSELFTEEFTSTRTAFGRTDEATYQGKAIKLQIDPLKLSWTVGANVNPETAENVEEVPSAGPYPEARDWFTGIMEKWLTESCPPIRRLAFGPKLIIQTESREEAYGLLSQYLPGVQVDVDSTEFQYRINRKRKIASGLTINRLATWSAVNIKIEWRAESSANSTHAPITKNSYDGCFLRLDINTDNANTDAMPSEQIGPLWQELQGLADEIAANGDIR